MINAWHCENIYSGDPAVLTGQDCTVSSTSPSLSGTPDNPLITRDDGSVVFALGIIIFFLSVFFFATLFSALGMKSKL